MRQVGVIGCGAIGRPVARALLGGKAGPHALRLYATEASTGRPRASTATTTKAARSARPTKIGLKAPGVGTGRSQHREGEQRGGVVSVPSA
jgi:hypothetical protein